MLTYNEGSSLRIRMRVAIAINSFHRKTNEKNAAAYAEEQHGMT
jgi:hypothetical protein